MAQKTPAGFVQYAFAAWSPPASGTHGDVGAVTFKNADGKGRKVLTVAQALSMTLHKDGSGTVLLPAPRKRGRQAQPRLSGQAALDYLTALRAKVAQPSAVKRARTSKAQTAADAVEAAPSAS